MMARMVADIRESIGFSLFLGWFGQDSSDPNVS
jgi:hypothetical protein